MIRVVVFDWGDTVMADFGTPGPMVQWPEVAAVEGVAGALQAVAARHEIALATNAGSDGRQVREALARVGLDRWFHRVFVSSEIGAAKPSPAFFSALLDGLQCLPAEIVMVGDSYANDVRGARAAGLRTIWYDPVGDPAPADAHDHDARIADMNSLPFVLHRLEMWAERSGRHMLGR